MPITVPAAAGAAASGRCPCVPDTHLSRLPHCCRRRQGFFGRTVSALDFAEVR